jgi:uncharacterized protein
MIETLARVVVASWLVLGQMAPYLLFGFLVAGILSVCFSPQWIERHLGRRGFGPVVKASLLGVPLPLCSCGVIPVAASIRRHGASRAATTSFLLSTPQTGVDSIAITYALLGPIFALFRPIAALITGLIGGGLVQLFGEQDPEEVSADGHGHACNEPCCAGKESRNFVWRSLYYGFVTLPRDIGVALLLGVVVAGAITAIVPAGDELKPYLGGGIGSILIMMAIGVPIYVCAAASIPIAAGLIHLGASPGAALAFLISGPATNAATITTTWKLMGRRSALLYLLTVAVSAVGCALLLDWIFSFVPYALPQLDSHVHQHMHEGGWMSAFWAVVLLAVIGVSYFRLPRKESGVDMNDESAGPNSGKMTDAAELGPQRLEFAVSGMTCAHCAETVSRTIRGCPGVKNADVDLKKGRAVVTGEHLDHERLTAAVNSLGYEMHLE